VRGKESIRTRRLSLRTILKRLDDVVVRLNDPKRLNEYMNIIMANRTELEILMNLLPFDPGLKQDNECIFGHFDELHERIIGKDGTFDETIKRLESMAVLDKNVVFKIGVTRHNFFCINEMVKLCMRLKGVDCRSLEESFNVFPVDKIIHNFIEYIRGIQEAIENASIELFLCDEELIEILQIIQFHMQREKVSDRDLVRLLGVIAEHAFIGPQTIVFDPYHRCNIQCRHCFVHNPAIQHREGFLERKFSLEKFKSIIDDSAELKVDGIILQGDGEPLLYDKFFDMLRYARSKDIGVLFFTNGSLIHEKESRELIDLGVKEIYCSFPSGTSATYAQVTTIGTEATFNTIIVNLKTLVRIRKEQGKLEPRLKMTHVIHALNYHELIEMAKVDAEIGADAARFYLIRLDDNNQSLKLSEREIEVIKKDLPIATKIFMENGIDFVDNIMFQLEHYDKDTGAWSKDIFLQEGCTIGWYFCLIPALYDVSMCCHLRTVGDLNKQSFKELWNSREYRRYRIKAKFLKENKGYTFLNGVKLYDEHCEHCDNHQTLITNLDNLYRFGLYRFLR